MHGTPGSCRKNDDDGDGEVGNGDGDGEGGDDGDGDSRKKVHKHQFAILTIHHNHNFCCIENIEAIQNGRFAKVALGLYMGSLQEFCLIGWVKIKKSTQFLTAPLHDYEKRSCES